jgi:hypothetical protein
MDDSPEPMRKRLRTSHAVSSRLVSGLPGDAMFVEVQLPSLGHLQDYMMPEHMMSQLLILLVRYVPEPQD